MRMYDRVTVLHDDPDKNMVGTVVGTASYCVDDRDFTTMDGVGTMRTEYVVVLDYKDQAYMGEDVAFISHLIVHEDCLEPAPWYVNVYEEDRGYGGPEEGGWWYNIATPVWHERLDTKDRAEARKLELEEMYPEEGDRPVSSVIYSGGAYTIRIENHPPVAQPQTTPHYE